LVRHLLTFVNDVIDHIKEKFVFILVENYKFEGFCVDLETFDKGAQKVEWIEQLDG